MSQAEPPDRLAGKPVYSISGQVRYGRGAEVCS